MAEGDDQGTSGGGYTPLTSGWIPLQKLGFLVFSMAIIVGLASFITLDFLFVKTLPSLASADWSVRPWGMVLGIGFFASLQLLWGGAIVAILRSANMVRLAMVGAIPLLLIALPLGIIAFQELTRPPPPPSIVTY